MKPLRLTLSNSLLILAGWLSLTVVIGQLLSSGAQQALASTVTNGVGIPWVLALLLLCCVARLNGDRRALGLDPPLHWHSWRLVWLPLAYACAMLALDLVKGMPPQRVLVFVAINTALVGLSEELMFRGVLFAGFLSRFTIWPAMLFSSAIFGAAHALNVFTIGQLDAALLQSACAFLQGFGYLAIRIRTGSLWPMVLVHAMWDFSLISGALAPRTELSAPSNAVLFGPILIALPLFLYGLFLMRGHSARAQLSMESKR
jgi:membrane protease YdiL (CAAX protease family)